MGCGASKQPVEEPSAAEWEQTGMMLFENITNGGDLNLAVGTMTAEVNRRLSQASTPCPSQHGHLAQNASASGRHSTELDFSIASTIQLGVSSSMHGSEAGSMHGRAGTGNHMIDDMYSTQDPKVVMSKMRHKRYDAIVQEHGCKNICRLSLTPEQREILCQESAPQAVVQAMDRLRNSAAVQEHGCRAVRLLSQDPAGRDKLAFEGAIRATIDALNSYHKNQVLAEHALVSLRHLGSEPQHRERIVCGGGTAAIRQAMLHHNDKPEVHELGKSVLVLLEVESESLLPGCVASGRTGSSTEDQGFSSAQNGVTVAATGQFGRQDSASSVV